MRADAATVDFDDPTGLLEWPAPDRGVLLIATDDDAKGLSTEITQLVRRWIAA